MGALSVSVVCFLVVLSIADAVFFNQGGGGGGGNGPAGGLLNPLRPGGSGPGGPLAALLPKRCKEGLCPFREKNRPNFIHKRDVEDVERDDDGVIIEESSVCGTLCVSDNACPGQKKCCPTGCGYDCFDPVYVVE